MHGIRRTLSGPHTFLDRFTALFRQQWPFSRTRSFPLPFDHEHNKAFSARFKGTASGGRYHGIRRTKCGI
jgi:hypothetical protein